MSISPSGYETLALLNDVTEPTFKQFRVWIEELAESWENNHKIYEVMLKESLAMGLEPYHSSDEQY